MVPRSPGCMGTSTVPFRFGLYRLVLQKCFLQLQMRNNAQQYDKCKCLSLVRFIFGDRLHKLL